VPLTIEPLERDVDDALEEPLARPEHQRDDVQPQLVDGPRREILVDRRAAAGDGDVGVAGGRAGPGQGRLDPIGDEGERRPALHRQRLARMVGEDEDRRVVGRVVAPPALPVEIPVAAAGTEHVAAHHVRPGRGDGLDGGGVGLRLLEHPAVQAAVDALAEGRVRALVRPGREAVDRHRHVTRDLRHAFASSGSDVGADYHRIGADRAFSTGAGRLAPGGALAPGQRHEDVVIVRAHTRGSRHRRPG
jgi:hypothetical protein